MILPIRAVSGCDNLMQIKWLIKTIVALMFSSTRAHSLEVQAKNGSWH